MKKLKSILIIILVIFLSGCSSNNNMANNNKLKTLNIEEWKNLYDYNKDYVILDVRTKEEFDSGHIKGAINIDFYNSNFKEELNKLDKNKKYLIYCRSGARSYNTLKLMEGLKFIEVYNLNGGILAWSNSGFKLE